MPIVGLVYRPCNKATLIDPSAGIYHHQKQNRTAPFAHRLAGCTLLHTSKRRARDEAPERTDKVCRGPPFTFSFNVHQVRSRTLSANCRRCMRSWSRTSSPITFKTMKTRLGFSKIYKKSSSLTRFVCCSAPFSTLTRLLKAQPAKLGDQGFKTMVSVSLHVFVANDVTSPTGPRSESLLFSSF